ncbi:TetR/AcrR family transcriptional regulator [Alteromonas sediminis]|uniref:TetR/AcrR family transcriptional regulator n=1 Tax=Alteromonas sediminis TaxID=2259342 RepID=A0A3N5Y0E6_9ALTE|nr:TetR/AcrR family transcriptional regulator [Alteromonas sediminis]RPJ65946.1 TetR/AcrR family transcriptional regulator [Alteromonas sediminis]
MKTSTQKTGYHHGDLRKSLVETAQAMLKEDGIECLSLRKLAVRVGVSRTAPYHHFKDKNALLCAIAQNGFEQWTSMTKETFSQQHKTLPEQYRDFVRGYIGFATTNPELYDLMFGRTIWKQNAATESLKEVAYPSFQYQVQLTRRWQQEGVMPKNLDSLRLAQVTWGTLHGIARLLIDGIYADNSHIEEMCDVTVAMFTRSLVS